MAVFYFKGNELMIIPLEAKQFQAVTPATNSGKLRPKIRVSPIE
jgi:hypothetical protein